MKRKLRNFTWEEPKFSKEDINWAGKIISGKKKASSEGKIR
jgi:hypothetical protein